MKINNKFISILLVAMVIIDIADGSFKRASILTFIKLILLITCFILLFISERKDGK